MLTIDEIKKLDAERTPGDWAVIRPCKHLSPLIVSGNKNIIAVNPGDYDTEASWLTEEADEDFIVAAPQITKQYIELYEEHEKLKEKLQACISACQKLTTFIATLGR